MNESDLAKLLKDNPDLRAANARIRRILAEHNSGIVSAARLKEQFLHTDLDRRITITLPWPPSLNKLYRHAGRRVYLTPTARAYTAEAHRILRDAGHTSPTTLPVEMTIHQYRPRDAGDIDNYQKLLLDSLQGFLYVNDKQVHILHLHQHIDRKHPGIDITIKEVLP